MSKLNLKRKLFAAFFLCATTPVFLPAQTITVLHSFANTDGANPFSPLIQGTDGNFYGVTSYGANPGCCAAGGAGTVFKITPSGTLTTLYNFCSQAGCTDGANPYYAGLVEGTDGNFYGTTAYGGAHPSCCAGEVGTNSGGTVFRITPSGTLTTLYSFCSQSGCADGANPYYAGLVEGSDGNLYGTTVYGGDPVANNIAGGGAIFQITPSGAFTKLYGFYCAPDLSGCPNGNSPSQLILGKDGNFYGTTAFGGANLSSCPHECGTVFQITPSGTLTTLHSFSGGDGGMPIHGVIQGSDGNFYGTTVYGGANNDGTVFRITPDGTLTTLYSFPSTSQVTNVSPFPTQLFQATDGNFYGGTASNYAYQITPSGTLTASYVFTDGFGPTGLIQGSNGALYGTTTWAGANGDWGTVFSLSIQFKPSFTLSVATAGSGTGAVSSNPAGINCGTSCSASFPTGTTVSLTASPASGSEFSGWSGACSGTGACSVTMNAAESVTATFNPTTPTDFSLTPASASLTEPRGGQMTDVVTVAPQNGSFASAIQLSCIVSGPSPMPTCALSPASVTPGANSATSTLTITAPAASAMLRPIIRGRLKFLYASWLPLPGIVLFGISLIFRKQTNRRRNPWLLAGSLLTLFALMAGCGGGSGAPPPPQNYTVTVTGISGAIQHTTQVTVTVQ